MTAEEMLWRAVTGFSTLLAILLSIKALKKDRTTELVKEIFADERWGKMLDKIIAEAREAGRVAAADRVQVLINPEDYMPRELQDQKNAELERRLESLERKVDDVPAKTAREVLSAMRQGGMKV
jgi:hypothetical protein